LVHSVEEKIYFLFSLVANYTKIKVFWKMNPRRFFNKKAARDKTMLFKPVNL